MSEKLDKFKESIKNLEEFEKTQPTSIDTPNVSDVTKAFMKNRNEVKIGERKYVIKKFGIRHTMDLIPVLGSSFLVPLSALFRQGITASDEDEAVSGLTEGLYMLFDNIGNSKLQGILEVLLENTTFEGTPVDLDEHFDDIADVFQVAVKVLEINFQNFIRSLGLTQLTSWAEGISKLQQS